MTILTDGTHVVSTKDLVELRNFCDTMGIHRRFYHSGSRHPHYDLPRGWRDREMPGAKTVPTRDLVRMLRGSKVVDNEEIATVSRRGRRPKCYACGTNDLTGGRYIHHVPGHPEVFQGGRACAKCAPGEVAKLVASGELVLYRARTRVKKGGRR